MNKSIRSAYDAVLHAMNVAAPILLRLTIGWVFVWAGWGKLNNLSSTIEFFGSLGIPVPMVLAPFVALVEFVGGLFVLAGFHTRCASLFLGFIMIVALLTAKTDSLGSLDSLVDTTDFLYLVMCVALAAYGAGRWSVDTIWRRKP